MSRRVLALGMLVTLAAGCTPTLTDLRETPPVREVSIATTRPRAEVAACTMDGLETGREGDWISYRLLNRTPDQTSVLGTMRGGGPIFEAMFTSNGAGMVTVSTRSPDAVIYWRVHRLEREDFWPLVEKCAALQPAAAR